MTKEAGSKASSFPQITEFTLSSNEADVSNGEVALTATAKADETVRYIEVKYTNEEENDDFNLSLSKTAGVDTDDLTGKINLDSNQLSGTYYPSEVYIETENGERINLGDLLAPVPAQIRSQAITVKGGLETDSTQKETVDTKLQIEGIEFDKSIYIRSCETPIYAAGNQVEVDQPFTQAVKLNVELSAIGNLKVGSTLTINAEKIDGLENGDKLVYNFYASDDNGETYSWFQSGEKNTLTISKRLIWKVY